ncbi:MAG: hypothetical protein LUC24_02190 [Bacteroidales bacterium]|nr:hypothetical protein [Bacteroidales bacterium]
MKWWQWILFGLAAAAIALLALHDMGLFRKAEVQEAVTVRVDTLTVHDTVRIIEPREVERTVIRTVYVPATDTLTLHDTLYIRLKRESVKYADSTYTAYVSGIRPRLDSIYVYPETRYINTMVETVRTEKKKHWGVGIMAGYGISTQGFVPYIGLGLSYNLVTF